MVDVPLRDIALTVRSCSSGLLLCLLELHIVDQAVGVLEYSEEEDEDS